MTVLEERRPVVDRGTNVHRRVLFVHLLGPGGLLQQPVDGLGNRLRMILGDEVLAALYAFHGSTKLVFGECAFEPGEVRKVDAA